MSEAEPDESASAGDQPGKLRTWWHPLLSRLLSYYLSPGFVVQEEVSVGRLPRRLDLILTRLEDGYLSEARERALTVLVQVSKRYTLLEFKGPTDHLQQGDVGQLYGGAFLWHSQNGGTIAGREISLLILAPCVTEGYRQELSQLGWESSEREPGLHQVTGGAFATWLIETDVMAAQRHPILTLFSRQFLRDPAPIMKEWCRTGHRPLLAFMLQQIQQFRASGEDFAMQHTDTQYLGKLEEDLLQAVIEAAPVEKRLQGLTAEERLDGLTTEERLDGLSAEERLDGLTTEERLDGLSAEERLDGLTTEERLDGLSAEERLDGLTTEERLDGLSAEERLDGLTTEERLKGLSVDDRLEGLSAEELFAGLSKEQTERLRQLLERKSKD